MPEMLGNKLLPETVAVRRREVRDRLREFRRPVRDFREQNVPGPDIVGTVESQITELRDNFVRRESALSSIRQRRSGSGNGGSEPPTSSGTESQMV